LLKRGRFVRKTKVAQISYVNRVDVVRLLVKLRRDGTRMHDENVDSVFSNYALFHKYYYKFRTKKLYIFAIPSGAIDAANSVTNAFVEP
jgi:hypothetical protein